MSHITAPETSSPEAPAPASQPRRGSSRWRVVDIVVAAVIGVAAGVIYFVWNQLYNPLTEPLKLLLPGLQGILYGVWLLAGVAAGLIIRKPGAAVFASVVAASFSAMLGAQWAFMTIEGGLVQGLGAELVFLLVAYRRFGLPTALLAGLGSGIAMGINDLIFWYPGADTLFQVVYLSACAVSGAVIAGLGGWALTRALARTGALSRFASGREVTARA
ncbi:ECF transporter S component [Leucobacter sp. M11]|uniref:ECF transporter S component n=1 Tax=Leucobacter sp. M11 TaxID=2993565 RepID=UPI002D80A36A|nr:ECF transporter S component [Leucobacter sp. M11]MEB4614233.1 ECF transporter S component [Leucobacter sp. M11]